MYPRFRRARAHKGVQRTAGWLSVTSTTWVNLDTALDLTLAAQVGDTIEAQVSGMWANETPTGRMDIATVVNGGIASTFGASVGGWLPWSGHTGVYSSITGSAWRVLTSADIQSGLVTLRLRVRNDQAGTRQVIADASYPLWFMAKNLGPADPT